MNLTFLGDASLPVAETVKVLVVEAEDVNMLKEEMVIEMSQGDDNTCGKKRQ